MSIYQHFRKHEHPFVDQVLSWKEQVERSYRHYLTDFLDPREQHIIESVIGSNNEDISYHFLGGVSETERKRAIIAPYYEEITDDLFDLSLLEATYPEQFVTLRHQDVMGTFLSLGIDRKKLGDIVVGDGVFQFVMANDIKPYVKQNLTRVKNSRVSLKTRPLDDILPSTDRWESSLVTIPSLRLDNLVKEIYRMSRSKATELIKRQRVKVNFTYIEDPAAELMAGDIISVRGFGRSKLISIEGETRKQKTRLEIARLMS